MTLPPVVTPAAGSCSLKACLARARRPWPCSFSWRVRSAGEPVLYVTLSETEEELRAVAESHGWTLDGIDVRELTPAGSGSDPDEQYTMFHPSEVELARRRKRILARRRTAEADARRLRFAVGAAAACRERRCAIAGRSWPSSSSSATATCTVLLLDDLTATDRDLQVQSIAHGGDPARAAQPRVRLRAPAAARGQVSRECSSAAAITTT